MSGGHYNYAYRKMEDLACQIGVDATSPKDSEIPQDILDHMAFVSCQIRALAEAAHDIEWLMSYDYGYDTLREQCESWKLSSHLR